MAQQHDDLKSPPAGREKNSYNTDAKTGTATPKLMLRGDRNPTKSGGINRPTQGGYRKD